MPQKIMLVEDDDSLREIYAARLQAEDYLVISASDGEEALAIAVKEKPDLIISDIMMPKISGFDLLDILRSTPETKNTKIIMMTALSQAEDKARAGKLGADRYLVKSQITLEDMVKAIHEVIDESVIHAPDVTPLITTAPATPTQLQPTPSTPIQPPAFTATPTPVPVIPPQPQSMPTPAPYAPTMAIPVIDPGISLPPVAVPPVPAPAAVDPSTSVMAPPVPSATTIPIAYGDISASPVQSTTDHSVHVLKTNIEDESTDISGAMESFLKANAVEPQLPYSAPTPITAPPQPTLPETAPSETANIFKVDLPDVAQPTQSMAPSAAPQVSTQAEAVEALPPVTPLPSAVPTPQSDGNASSVHHRVIQPINDLSKPGPDIYQMLNNQARIDASNQALSQPETPDTPHVIPLQVATPEPSPMQDTLSQNIIKPTAPASNPDPRPPQAPVQNPIDITL